MTSKETLETGTVKWFSASKGYGFIQLDGGDKDVFCHFSAINAEGYRQLSENQRVEFEIVEGKKGLEAKNVTVIQ